MSFTVKLNAGTGEPCTCGNHLQMCDFGGSHSFVTPWNEDGAEELQHSRICSTCGAKCAVGEGRRATEWMNNHLSYEDWDRNEMFIEMCYS